MLAKSTTKISVIEFQKRDLPHAHILINLQNEDNEDKLHMADDIYSVISAEIPDPVHFPNLFHTITKCMMHDPCCGNANPYYPCMEINDAGKLACSKGFPKAFNPATNITANCFYPEYRQSRMLEQDVVRGESMLDNRHVIPYNP